MLKKVSIIILVGLVLITGCGKKKKEVVKELTPVVVEKLVPQPARNTKIFTGVVRAKNEVDLTAEVAGVMADVYVDVGDRVKKGQVLGKIEDTAYKAQYESAKAGYDLAKVSFERQEKLYKENVISQQEFDTISAQFKQANSQYILAKKALEDCQFKAPFSGTIAVKFYKKGNFVKVKKPVFTVINIDQVEIPFGVTEEYAVKIHKGKKARLDFDSLPGRNFYGRVSSIGLMADKITGTFPVEVTVKNKSSVLKPGMVAKIELGIDYFPKARVVKLDTLVNEAAQKGVFVLKDDMTVSYNPVEIAFEFGDNAMIKKGLNYGDLVVVKGNKNIVTGEKVVTSNAL